MRIPFAKPWIPDASKKHVAEAMETGRIGRSDYYAARCREHLQDLVNREFILLVNSGTMALQCALAARPEWDTVRVPDYTFGATANAVLLAGRKLELCTRKEMAGMPGIYVAIHGECVDPAAQLVDLAQAFQCPNAMPTRADLAGSFFVNKLITSGEGGYYATNDESRYHLARSYADHGRAHGGYTHWAPGANGHMPDLNAALLLGQLENWDDRVADMERQRDLWKTASYKGWCALHYAGGASTQSRLIRRFRKAGIDARKDFPPLRECPAFRGLETKGFVNYHQNVLLPAWHGIPTESIELIESLL